MSKKQRIYLAAAIFVVAVGFYSYWTTPARPWSRGGAYGKFKDVPFSRFAHAESLRRAKSDELVDAVTKVIEQNGLPADVFVEYKDPGENERHEATNIAVTLHAQFNEYYMPKEIPAEMDAGELQKLMDKHLANSDLGKLWDASPEGAWDIDQQRLDTIKTTLGNAALAQFESKRQAIRKKLEAADTHFGYIFVYPDSLKSVHHVGKVVNTEASKYLAAYALLEEYAVAQALLEGNIWDAIDALAYTFRIALLASNLEVVGVRCDAAIVRLQAFEVMQRIVLDPKFEKDHMIALRDILSEQYDDWTPEYITWFGDRASGIALYHRIDVEGLDMALEKDSLDFLKSRGDEDTFWKGFIKYSEADEAFYLRSMQKILDVCGEPFVKRLDVLNQINEEIRKKENTHDEKGVSMEPFVAVILLKDVERLVRLFAQDKSALSRAMAAIGTSLGQTNADDYHDPFTGKSYETQKEAGLISITTETLPRPFRVPSFTN